MNESTARVERSPVGSPSRPGYLWEVPQKPVSIYLPLDMIDRLEGLVVENFRSLTSRGSEIGGLLVGRASQGSPLVVLVENFELITCDYSRGPLFRLSEADMGRFERVIEQYNTGNGPRVVGFFRSHTRKGLSLDPDDTAFLDARFRDPQQFALLVRPSARQASTGAIFIRENGTMRTEASYLEFPFRSSQLSPSAGPPKVEMASAVAEPPAAPPPAPTPAPQKPAGRGQIVPIASRREVTPPPEPVLQAAPVVEPPPPPVVQPPPPPPKAQVETTARTVEKPAEKPAARTVEKQVEKPAARTVEKPVEKPAARKGEPAVPKTLMAEAPAEATGGASKLIWVLVALALVALAGGGYMLYPGFHKSTSVPVTAGDASDLALRVEHSGPDLLLTWNRDSFGAKNGKVGKLQIFDGDSRQNYDIDRAQLASGLGVVYSPLTQDVSFKMEVTNDKGDKVGTGAARMLNSRPSPVEDQKTTAATKPTTPPPAPNIPPEQVIQPTPPPAEEQEKTTAATTPRKSFSLQPRLRTASQTDLSAALPDAPSVGAGAPPQVGSMPGATMGGIAPPPPKSMAPPPPPGKAQASSINQAVVVYKRDPEYPRIAQQMNQHGVVELMATIGVDGRVKGVKILKGPPILAKAAQEAVMQWIYKPTLLNGTPVENETHISINFDDKK